MSLRLFPTLAARCVCVFIFSLASAPLWAVDGVFEISASCASFGCFNGDSSGLPVTITQPGSYRLTSNLSTTSANTSLIVVNANNVTIDLNGFELSGPVSCSGTPVTSCSNTGSGFAVDINGDQVTVHNGSIRGAGSDCISATLNNDHSRLYDLTVTECGGAGLVLVNGRVDNVVVARTDGVGINLLLGTALVTNSVVRGSGDLGQVGGYCSNNVYLSNANANQAGCVQLGANICGSGSC